LSHTQPAQVKSPETQHVISGAKDRFYWLSSWCHPFWKGISAPVIDLKLGRDQASAALIRIKAHNLKCE
jgi:hypothetical protein